MKRELRVIITVLLWGVAGFLLGLLVRTAHSMEIPQSLGQCTALCSELFPGTPTVPPVPDSPPVEPPVVGVLPFAHAIEYERSTDQGGGLPGVLFRTLPVGSVTAVSVNGEWARVGTPYKGSPVFILSKPDAQYTRPLVFVVKMSDGKTYTAVSGSSTSPGSGTSEAGYNSRDTYTAYGVRNGGRKAWRVPRKGPSFGPSVLVVFENGHKVLVEDTSHNYREKDGFVFKPGIGPNGEGEHDTGTAHGGVYLHAPYGNKSNKATFHYNK